MLYFVFDKGVNSYKKRKHCNKQETKPNESSKLKNSSQVLAEERLASELDIGIKSAKEKGWISFSQAKTRLGV